MEVFFVKYSGNQPVAIRTHQLISATGQWIQALFNVADVIGAVKQALSSKLGAIDPDELTLHLPSDVPRSALDEDCFMNIDEFDAILRIGMPLARLNRIGTDDAHPLIIKTKS
ncbi:hypothetical protein HDU84_001000, partial [Entophlyctis sp. JEL0112]